MSKYLIIHCWHDFVQKLTQVWKIASPSAAECSFVEKEILTQILGFFDGKKPLHVYRVYIEKNLVFPSSCTNRTYMIFLSTFLYYNRY